MVVLSFILMPLMGHWAAVTFSIATWDQIRHALAQGLLPSFIAVLVAWAGLHCWRALRPVREWLEQNPGGGLAPSTVHTPLRRFSPDYWGLYLCYVLIAPLAFYWSTNGTGTPDLRLFGQFLLLQLVVAILIGLPGYLLSMGTLGRLVALIGMPWVILSIKSKLMLLGGLMPLLTNALLLLYYWTHMGYLPGDVALIFAGLSAVTLLIAWISIRSVSHGLAPVQHVLGLNGAASYAQLANLKAHSTDEIGYLTATLGRLFQRLDDQQSHVRAIVETAAEGIIVTDEKGIIITFNPAAQQLFGYATHEVVGKPLSLILPGLGTISPESGGTEQEVEGVLCGGERKPMALRISPMEQSGRSMYTCLVADISERKAAEQRLRRAEARYRDLVETAHDLIWAMDPQWRWTYLNEASRSIYGCAPEEMIGRYLHEYQSPEYSQRDEQAFAEVLAGKEMVEYETVHLDSHGSPRHLSINARPHVGANGKVTSISGTARDITEQKAYENQLAYQAEHDTVTGLYNRHYFHQELDRLVARVARSGAECALFYIDIDQFKYVNDTLGHAAGDQLLMEFTHLLSANVREGDLLARFGGDEFTLLLYNIDTKNALRAAEKLRAMFENYKFYQAEGSFNISCSIGMTIIDNSTHSADEALAQADLACNVAKTRGRNRIYVYNPEDQDKIGMAEDMGWAARVREVLEHDRFQLAFQPIIHIADGKVDAHEVLLRMPYDDGQIILPGGFMPAAERFGLIHSIDRWIATAAIRRLTQLRSEGHDVRFAINLSGRAFEDSSLLLVIKTELEESGLDPALLTFEITETAAIANLTAATRFISALRDIGCQFALDDFGSGFCSFTYLKHLPVDKLKIDGSFVQGLARTPVDQAMVRSMNQVAHALGKFTIAESVEDEETLVLLREYGVDFAQGHFLGRPRGQIIV